MDENQTMTKQEVADYLNVSIRTVDNYINHKYLAVAKVKGKTNKVAVCDRREVEEFKIKLERSSSLQRRGPTIDSETQTLIKPEDSAIGNRANGKISKVTQTTQMITIDPAMMENLEMLARNLNPANWQEQFTRLEDSFRQVAMEAYKQFAPLIESLSQPAVAVKDKVYLTRDEAVMLSGLPKTVISQALKSGKLPAKLHGSYRIYREDLDAFAKEYSKSGKLEIAQRVGA